MYKEKRLFAKHKKKRPKTMSKFINPFTDYGFKLIFGREVSKDLLIEFLNDLLEGERVITDLQFLNNEHCRSIRKDEVLSMMYIAPRTQAKKSSLKCRTVCKATSKNARFIIYRVPSSIKEG